jgi:hypothetical protein
LALNDEWMLPSSSGRELLSGTFLEKKRDGKGSIVFLTNISLVGRFWRPEPFSSNKTVSMEELPLAYIVSIPQLLVPEEAILKLLSQLDGWYGSYAPVSVDMCHGYEGNQRFLLDFKKSDVLISKKRKPACTVEYGWNNFEVGRWRFIVDHTCINLLIESLRNALDES